MLVDGQRCAVAFDDPPIRGDPHNATMTLALAGLALGTHMLQVQPDRGWVRNEAPLVAQP